MRANSRIIDVLRHGEPVGGSRYRGSGIDDPLTEKGWQQMWEGVGECSVWDRIITSPMQRCSAFSQQLANQLDIPMIIDDRFREIGFGQWEGKSRQELQAERKDEFKAFYADPLVNTPQDAEPVQEFYQRISAAFIDVRRQYPQQNLLVVGHAGVSRAIVTDAIQAGAACMYRLMIKNGHVARLRENNDQINLEGLNLRLQDRD